MGKGRLRGETRERGGRINAKTVDYNIRKKKFKLQKRHLKSSTILEKFCGNS